MALETGTRPRVCPECGGAVIRAGHEEACGSCGLVVEHGDYIFWEGIPLHRLDESAARYSPRAPGRDTLTGESLRRALKYVHYYSKHTKPRIISFYRNIQGFFGLPPEVTAGARHDFFKVWQDGKRFNNNTAVSLTFYYKAIRDFGFFITLDEFIEYVGEYHHYTQKMFLRHRSMYKIFVRTFGVEYYISLFIERLFKSQLLAMYETKGVISRADVCNTLYAPLPFVIPQRGHNPKNLAAAIIYYKLRHMRRYMPEYLFSYGKVGDILGVKGETIRWAHSKVLGPLHRKKHPYAR